MKDVLKDKKGMRMWRSVKKAELCVVGLDDFTIPQDVALICAQLGGCSVANVGIEPMI